MADGSTFSTPSAAIDMSPPILLFHEGDFHDPDRLPGRALRMLALTTQLRLPARPPLRPGTGQPPCDGRPIIARRL